MVCQQIIFQRVPSCTAVPVEAIFIFLGLVVAQIPKTLFSFFFKLYSHRESSEIWSGDALVNQNQDNAPASKHHPALIIALAMNPPWHAELHSQRPLDAFLFSPGTPMAWMSSNIPGLLTRSWPLVLQSHLFLGLSRINEPQLDQ